MEQKGFTLIEVIVAIAVVAILAGVITPSVIKHLDDSKRARAQNDCLVIGAAIGSFYKDLGYMPTYDAAGRDRMNLLVSAGNTPTRASGISGWHTSTANARVDLMSNHMSANTPKAQTANIYPTTGEFAWRGAYQTEFPPDPWGNRYAINIGNTRNNTNTALSYAVWVLSSGPNGTLETVYNPNNPPVGTVLTTGGDDIAFRIK